MTTRRMFNTLLGGAAVWPAELVALHGSAGTQRMADEYNLANLPIRKAWMGHRPRNLLPAAHRRSPQCRAWRVCWREHRARPTH
jgi:hypothetical protein